MSDRRLLDVWNWLPIFYVVAQTEHLPTASRQLHITTSSISRTIRLLEDALGYQVFSRVGRTLRLNEAGRQWRSSIGESIDLFRSRISQSQAGRSETIHVGVTGPTTQGTVVAAIRDAQRIHGEMVPHLHVCPDTGNLLEQIFRNELELGFFTTMRSHAAIESQLLGTETTAAYCGRGHPSFAREHLTTEFALQFPFVAYAPQEADIWSTELARTVTLYVSDQAAALQLCIEGHFQAVLLETAAAPYVAEGLLRRLPVDTPATPLYVAYQLAATSKASNAILRAARQRLETTSVDVAHGQAPRKRPTVDPNVRGPERTR